MVKNKNGFTFKLFDGKITNIDQRGSINLNFKETTYELSKLDTNIRQENKINETESYKLISCLEKFIKKRKNDSFRCNKDTSFVIKDIYEEIFQRIINPVYIIILSLISSLIILKPKLDFIHKYLKIILFITGFLIILFSQLGYKFITFSIEIELMFILLPIIFIIFFYSIILLKTKFKMRLL